LQFWIRDAKEPAGFKFADLKAGNSFLHHNASVCIWDVSQRRWPLGIPKTRSMARWASHERLVGTIYQQCRPACTASSFTLWCEDMYVPSFRARPPQTRTCSREARAPDNKTAPKPPNISAGLQQIGLSFHNYCTKKPAPVLSTYAASGISCDGRERGSGALHSSWVKFVDFDFSLNFSPQFTRMADIAASATDQVTRYLQIIREIENKACLLAHLDREPERSSHRS
jgi:hypothetical protein